MTRADKALVVLLYVIGVGAPFALVPVVMPFSWMAATHRWLGLGEMPAGPIVEYLARMLSAFYVLVCALCLVVASDLERYRPLARFLGVAFGLMGVAFLGIDLSAGMPWWWTAIEGLPTAAFGLLLYYLARPGRRADGKTNADVRVREPGEGAGGPKG
jgi:formate hydrogenlyase subunit 3/multisubunit Na+/H+ antiporter MnhD subunit